MVGWALLLFATALTSERVHFLARGTAFALALTFARFPAEVLIPWALQGSCTFASAGRVSLPTPQGVSTFLLVINTLTLACVSVVVRQPCIIALIAASFVLSQAVSQPTGRRAAVVVDDNLEDVTSALKMVVFGQD